MITSLSIQSYFVHQIMKLAGIHHITAIASDPQRNIDFYSGVLGLRLVKQTVNFDDPGTYHFYYGDERGTPGTILTFFPWPNARPGKRGAGQATSVAFRVPEGSLGYWYARLKEFDTSVEEPGTRPDGLEGLTIYDPDGLQLKLVAQDGGDEYAPWTEAPVPTAQAIRGFYGLSLSIAEPEATLTLLREGMKFTPLENMAERIRFQVGDGASTAVVEILPTGDGQPGRIAAGSVHHIAWRTPDDPSQLVWQREISNLGLFVTRVMDRRYFRSIYFREPGGVLFEIATDPPGFALDETFAELGSELRLPPWMEARREEIEDILPEIKIPVKTR
jgi:glyoxalase family protein